MGKLTISMAMFNSYYVSWPEGISSKPHQTPIEFHLPSGYD